MLIEVLISTMNQTDFSLLDRMHIQSKAVVINQCGRREKSSISYKGNEILWIDSDEVGLSKSRNMALRNATGDICLLADDDEILADKYPEVIQSVFENTMFSAARFMVKGIETEFKRYGKSPCNVGYLKSLKMSSVEIAFRKDDIIKNEIFFDEALGAGSEFLMGEENAFVFSLLRKNLKIQYVPEVIALLHIGNSTWFTGYNEPFFIGRGAAFTAMSKKMAIPFIYQFAFRKRHLYCREMGTIKAIKYMLEGRKRYLSIER